MVGMQVYRNFKSIIGIRAVDCFGADLVRCKEDDRTSYNWPVAFILVE